MYSAASVMRPVARPFAVVILTAVVS